VSTTVTLDGSTNYAVPAEGESGWGEEVTNYLVAIASNVLAKKGGTFTLLADVDTGATYGFKSAFFKSRSSNIAGAGVLRLANAESVGWRNAANAANLLLTVNSSDWLQFNSVDLVDKSTAQTLTNKTLVAASNTITTTATGNLAAVELNAALAELQTDIDTRATSSSLTTHTGASTGVHGVSGAVVGTTDSQALTNKTIVAVSNTITTVASGNLAATELNAALSELQSDIDTRAPTSGKLSQFASTTSSELAGVISDETGSGALVFATSPTLTTPTLGVASATSVNKVALTAPATGSTLTIADGKTLTASNTLTLSGTDSSSVAFGAGGTVAYTANKLSAFAATTSSELAGVISDETGSGALVFGTSPTIASPTVTGTLLLQNPSGAQPELHLSEDPDNGTNVVKIKAPATLGADYTLTLPTDDGGANQVLQTDGSGELSWATVASTVTTTRGDLIKRGAAADERLAIGTASYVLKSDGTDPSWGLLVNANIDAAAAIAGSKIVAAASSVAGAVSTGTQTFTGAKTFETQLIGKGTATNDSAAAGYIGEYTSASPGGNVTPGSTGAWKTVTSISLTAGDWDVSGGVAFTQGTAANNTYLQVAISSITDGADSATVNAHTIGPTSNSLASTKLSVGPRRISLASTTTYYLTAIIDYTSLGTAVYTTNSILCARRVR
jgi:hypothetical protein